ncbi:hypothetical protein FHW00_003860 [Ochrobactrum sp. P6BSIII]|uniref:hypothetical protein n=1 Tax=unclassified Ochrobactrum TaxID=239106 RepID=UPI000DE516DB|nr:hypothetical protein [Ochrobactrum sp. P6BSIII]
MSVTPERFPFLLNRSVHFFTHYPTQNRFALLLEMLEHLCLRANGNIANVLSNRVAKIGQLQQYLAGNANSVGTIEIGGQ